MKHGTQVYRSDRSGFTISELLIASSVSLIVLGVAMGVFINVMRSWHGVELRMQADRDVNMAMSRIVYGMGNRFGLRSASTATNIASGSGWTVSYLTGGTAPQNNSFTYSTVSGNLVFNPGSQIAGQNLSYAWAQVQGRALVVTLRVDRVDGTLRVRRELGTKISFRNQ